MCNKCRALVECPVGEKRIVAVAPATVPEIVDFYGRRLFSDPVEMVIDKWPDGQIDCFIGQHVYDENNVGYGSGVDISHCPFCGQKLR